MNYKKGKTKRNVRCTICTPDKWRGNNSGRFKEKEELLKKQFKQEVITLR